MAEVIGLSASIIGIAGAGVSVVTALTKFGISYKDSNNKINELAARVSLTATILQAIGDTVKENEDGFKREAFMVTWNEVLDSCAGTYEKIQAAISKAKGKEAKRGRSGSFTTWSKLKWAIGGEERMKALEDSLEKSSHQVMMMQQVIQLTAIKLLGKSGKAPASVDLEEKKELMGKMDWIITGLVQSGMLNLDVDRGSANIVAVQTQRERQINHRSSFISTKSNGVGGAGKPPEYTPQDPFFEAYFIAPQSISRDLPDGAFGITDKPFDSYTTLILDTCLNLPSLQATLLEAESRGHPKSQLKRIQQILSTLPQAAMEQIVWLFKLRHEHSNEVAWDIVEIVKMAYHQKPGQGGILEISSSLDDQLWGFLVILRGQVGGTQMLLDIQKELFIPGAILKENRTSIVKNDNAKQSLQEELQELRSKRLEATQANDIELQEQIERDILEMTELFQDISSMVVQQGEAVYATEDNMDKANAEIEVAIHHARRSRRGRWLLPVMPFIWAAEKLGKIGTGARVGSQSKGENSETSPYEDESTPHISAEDGERILDDFLSTFSNLT